MENHFTLRGEWLYHMLWGSEEGWGNALFDVSKSSGKGISQHLLDSKYKYPLIQQLCPWKSVQPAEEGSTFRNVPALCLTNLSREKKFGKGIAISQERA